MGLIDFLIILAIIAGIVIGGIKGIIKQITSIAAFICAIICTRLFGDVLSDIIKAIIPELNSSIAGDWAAGILTHIIIFIFVYLTVSLIGSITRSMFNCIFSSGINRLCGSIFCSLKYLLALSLFLNLCLLVIPSESLRPDDGILNGTLYDFTIALAPKTLDMTTGLSGTDNDGDKVNSNATVDNNGNSPVGNHNN